MKTIEQLLELSKNPYYKFTADEQAVLNDFLSRKREKELKKSLKMNSKTLEGVSPVTVHNVIPKVIDRVEDAVEPTDAS